MVSYSIIFPDCNMYIFNYNIFCDIVEGALYSPIFKYLLKANTSKALHKLVDLVILVNDMSLRKVKEMVENCKQLPPKEGFRFH